MKHFYKDEEKICHFYSDSQNGREKTARIAIGKVLARSSLQDKVTITGAFQTLGNGADEDRTGKETGDLINDIQLGALAGDADTDVSLCTLTSDMPVIMLRYFLHDRINVPSQLLADTQTRA